MVNSFKSYVLNMSIDNDFKGNALKFELTV